MLDLVAARVARQDASEMPREPDGRLARARAGVPHRVSRRRYLRQEIEQGVRVARPECRVRGGNAGEMIVK